MTRKKTFIFKTILIIFFMLMSILAIGLVVEGVLRMKAKRAEEKEAATTNDPYREFTQQYLHPFYYFSFPQDLNIIESINNDVVSIDTNGFRGDGPEKRGGRKLAFIVGGSSVFGHGSSSNKTTISGYLNELQSEYYFVNAGVPSWISTQEFYRVSLQLLNYHPSLIIAYDGFNDAALSLYHYAYRYPPGTPESYEYLELWVSNIRERKQRRTGPFIIDPNYKLEIFRETKAFLRGTFPSIFPVSENMSEEEESEPMPPSQNATSPVQSSDYVQKWADRYIKNLELMHYVSKGYNCQFIAVWQTSLFQHRYYKSEEELDLAINDFHDRIFGKGKHVFKFYDFGNIFDKYYDKGEDFEEEVFLDTVHLTDKGNRMIAQEMVGIVEGEGLFLEERTSVAAGGLNEVVSE